MANKTKLPEVLRRHESEILSDWMRYQRANGAIRGNPIRDVDLREQSGAFLASLREAMEDGDGVDPAGPAFSTVRDFLAELGRTRERQGFTAAETATFVFSLKLPLFERLREEYNGDAAGLAAEVWTSTELIDKLGLLTAHEYQEAREQTILRQRQELLELSTPVVKLWDGILALPLIGTLDSERTQVVMESLLQEILRTGSQLAIIDITGVPTVDTLVAQHLLKTIAAARLMGADCIISGVRPQIAQTIVHLGVDLGDVATKATLADAFRLALKRSGLSIGKS